MYRSSPFRSTMNTNVITALGMCKVCTEAIHSVARKRQDWTCESTCETRKRENPKTRKREESTCGRENGENAKTAKTRKRRKQENRENGENAKTRKRRKPENRENGKNDENPKNGQKCSCFLVFNFSFSGFLSFLVFSFSGFLVPLAAPFWPGRVFYVLRLILTPQKWLFWGPPKHTLRYRFVHPSIGGSLGILREVYFKYFQLEK